MAENPIKYSDLIVPDDSIEKLIGQLETLQKTFTEVSESVKKEADVWTALLKSVSGATEEGKKKSTEAIYEAERLAKAERDLAYAQSETAKRVAELKEEQKKANYESKLQAQQAKAVEGSYNALSAQYRLNKMALNNLSAEMRATDPAARKLEEDTRKIYEEMKKLQEATGMYQLNVGNYEGAITSAIGANSKWFKSLQQMAGLFQGGLTQGIKTAGSAVAGFGKQLLALLANPIVLTIAAITAAFTALASGISSSAENTKTLQRVLAPFKGVLDLVSNTLEDIAGWLLKGVEGMEKLAMGASRLMERLTLVGNAFKKVNNALEENIRLTREKQALDKAEKQNEVEQAALRRNIAKWKRDAEMTDDPKRKAQLTKMALAAEDKMVSDEIILAQRELKLAQDKIKAGDSSAEALEKQRQAQIHLYQAEEEYYNRTTKLQSKLTKYGKGGDSTSGKTNKVKAQENEDKELERLQKQREQRELAAMRQAEDAKAALIEDEYDRERAETIYRYDRQIEDTRKKMSELGEEEVATKRYYDELLVSLEQQKWNKLADIADKEMKEAVDRETRDAQERAKRAQEEADKRNRELEKRKDLYDLLGFKLTDRQKEDIDDALEYAIGALNNYMEAWTAAADARKTQADSEVERVQRVLEAEIEARNQGYANDVETARKELEEAKKNQQKALQQQRQAHQAQVALDTATQASSLITATANIWKTFTTLGVFGIPAAIAAIALMWGSFAAAKIKAFEVAGMDTETYGEGTVELLQGGSHQSGNDVDLGRKKNGTRRRAEGGEYFAVINKRSSRKYRDVIPDVINSLNRDTFAEKYMGAYDGENVSVTVNGRNPDLKELTQSVNDIREQGRMRTYSENGSTVMIYKNLKRVVKNGN